MYTCRVEPGPRHPPAWLARLRGPALTASLLLGACLNGAAAEQASASQEVMSTTPVDARFRHVTLFASDNETVARWYRDMLGMVLDARFTIKRPDGSQIDVVRLRLGTMLMHVSRVPDLMPRDRKREHQGWRHVSFAVPDVDAAWSRMRALGADVVGTGGMNFDPPGYRVAFVRDPEGNFVELYQDAMR